MVNLALHLSFDAKVNDKQIWRALEDAALESLHHMTLQQICQLEWASMEQKPKFTSSRFNNFLINKATEAIETASATDLMNILQGFRKRASKDMYMKIRKTLI